MCAESCRATPCRSTDDCKKTVDRASVRCILLFMNTTLSSRGQLVLPPTIRRRDHLRPGQSFEIERIDRGEYRLIAHEPEPNAGLCDWLLACPGKGYFVPTGLMFWPRRSVKAQEQAKRALEVAYTRRILSPYFGIMLSCVSSCMGSVFACATRIRSNGSAWCGGSDSVAAA